MSTAAKTPNYNLSQVAGSDIPDWITDYTSDMKKIDEALKENADDIATVRPDEFSEESTYAAGDYCIKDNVIYKAKTAVEAGAFDISDWTATTIFDELSGLNQKSVFEQKTVHNISLDTDETTVLKVSISDVSRKVPVAIFDATSACNLVINNAWPESDIYNVSIGNVGSANMVNANIMITFLINP